MPTFKIKTKGHYDFIDITNKITELLNQSNIQSGIINIFVAGSTAALTIMEYENGSIKDIKNVRIADLLRKYPNVTISINPWIHLI